MFKKYSNRNKKIEEQKKEVDIQQMSHFAKYKEKESQAKQKYDMDKATDEIENNKLEKARKKKEEEEKRKKELDAKSHAEKLFIKDIRDMKMKKSKHGLLAKKKAVSTSHCYNPGNIA